jgi:hypothetical protein
MARLTSKSLRKKFQISRLAHSRNQDIKSQSLESFESKSDKCFKALFITDSDKTTQTIVFTNITNILSPNQMIENCIKGTILSQVINKKIEQNLHQMNEEIKTLFKKGLKLLEKKLMTNRHLIINLLMTLSFVEPIS